MTSLRLWHRTGVGLDRWMETDAHVLPPSSLTGGVILRRLPRSTLIGLVYVCCFQGFTKERGRTGEWTASGWCGVMQRLWSGHHRGFGDRRAVAYTLSMTGEGGSIGYCYLNQISSDSIIDRSGYCSRKFLLICKSSQIESRFPEFVALPSVPLSVSLIP